MIHNRKLYVCPKCNQWYSCEKNKTPDPCERCGAEPVAVHVDFALWNEMNDQQREQFKERYLKDHDLKTDVEYVDTQMSQTTKRLYTFSTVLFGLVFFPCVIGGVVAMITTMNILGFLGGAVIMVVGYLLGRIASLGFEALAQITEDLRAIRQAEERK